MAAKTNLVVNQGETWSQELLWTDEAGTPIDTSGMSARMQIRKLIASADVVAALGSDTGEIELGLTGAGDGEYNVKLTLSAAKTSALPATAASRNWFYDLELVDGDAVTRLLQGRFKVDLEVTR